MSKKEFIPRQIGRPNPRRETEIVTAYQNMLYASVNLQLATEYCLREVEGFGIDFFMESLKEGTEKFIRRKFIEINKVSIPGISTEKLMNSDLLDIQEIEHAIEERKAFDEAWRKVEATHFIYPLRKLYVDDQIGFELTEDFHEKLQQKIGRFTDNEKQNFILEKIKNLCGVLNSLNELGILNAEKGPTELTFISDWIEIDFQSPDGPFVVTDILFWKRRLRQFRDKPVSFQPGKTFDDFIA
jgi:hypothetical protein